MFSIVTLPDMSTILSSSTAFASPLFTDLVPLVFLAIGVVAAVVLVKYVRKSVSGGISRAFGGGRGGRKRKR